MNMSMHTDGSQARNGPLLELLSDGLRLAHAPTSARSGLL